MTATSKPIQHREHCTARPDRLRVLEARIVCTECGRYESRTDVPETPCVDCGQLCRADVKRCSSCFRTHKRATTTDTGPAVPVSAPAPASVPMQTRLVCRDCYSPVNRKGVCRAC